MPDQVTFDARERHVTMAGLVLKQATSDKAHIRSSCSSPSGHESKLQMQLNSEVVSTVLTMLRWFGSGKAVQLALGVVMEWIVALVQLTTLP